MYLICVVMPSCLPQNYLELRVAAVLVDTPQVRKHSYIHYILCNEIIYMYVFVAMQEVIVVREIV